MNKFFKSTIVFLATTLIIFGGQFINHDSVLAIPSAQAVTVTVDNSTNTGSVKDKALDRLNQVVDNNYNEETTDRTAFEYAGYLISVFFGLFGVIFVALLIYAGYEWMTAQGDKAKVSKAQGIIKTALIGIILTVAVYAIWQFVFVRIVQGQNNSQTKLPNYLVKL